MCSEEVHCAGVGDAWLGREVSDGPGNARLVAGRRRCKLSRLELRCDASRRGGSRLGFGRLIR